jgi:hypothetical protein
MQVLNDWILRQAQNDEKCCSPSFWRRPEQNDGPEQNDEDAICKYDSSWHSVALIYKQVDGRMFFLDVPNVRSQEKSVLGCSKLLNESKVVTLASTGEAMT